MKLNYDEVKYKWLLIELNIDRIGVGEFTKQELKIEKSWKIVFQKVAEHTDRTLKTQTKGKPENSMAKTHI